MTQITDSLIDLKNPPDLELLPFQKIGVEELLLRNNVLLGDEMGLGKTIQILSYLNIAQWQSGKLQKPGLKVLIVAPKSLTWNWYFEAEKWLTDKEHWSLDELRTVGNLNFVDLSRNFVIVSYEVVARQSELLASQRWNVVIFDEYHYIKNVSSKRYKGVRNLVESQRLYEKNEDGSYVKGSDGKLVKIHEAKFIGATGSPIVNYIDELFPLINLLDPIQWGSVGAFERRYVVRSRALKSYGRNTQELQDILRNGSKGRPGILVRRLKKEVLPELPAKRRRVIEFPSDDFSDLLKEQLKMFEGKDKGSEVDQLMEKIQEMNASGMSENEVDWESIIGEMKYNRKYFFEEMARIAHLVARAKLPQVLDYISDIVESWQNGEKLVIFAHHIDILEGIHQHCQMLLKNEKGSILIKGGQNDLDKQRWINEFQNNDMPRVIVGGIKVIGHGFTMTRASHCLFAEMDWVPSVITQAEDRLHRIGQENKILVEHLTLKNSLDAYKAKKIIEKQRHMNKVLNRDRS